MYSFVRYSTCASVPAQPHWHHQHKPTTHICARTCITVLGILCMYRGSLLSVCPFGSTTTDTAHYATNAANAANTGTPGLFDVRSPFKRVIPAPPAPLPTTTILPQSRPVTMSASYSDQHRESGSCTEIPIEPLYPPQFAHGIILHRDTLVILHRLDNCIGFCMFVCVIGFPGTSWYLVCGLLLCASRLASVCSALSCCAWGNVCGDAYEQLDLRAYVVVSAPQYNVVPNYQTT